MSRDDRFAFVHSTWFIAFTSACTVIALPLSIYLFIRSERSPKLTYSIQAPRSIVVDPSEVSALQLSVGSTVVTSPVAAVQIRIANTGTDSIRAARVLRTPEIVIATGAQILSARVLSRSRIVTDFQVKLSRLNTVALSWVILEPTDEAIVQIIYAGALDAEIRVEGAIEGQRQIQRVPWRRSSALVDAGKGFFAAIVPLMLVWLTMRIFVAKGLTRREDFWLIVLTTATITALSSMGMFILIGLVKLG